MKNFIKTIVFFSFFFTLLFLSYFNTVFAQKINKNSIIEIPENELKTLKKELKHFKKNIELYAQFKQKKDSTQKHQQMLDSLDKVTVLLEEKKIYENFDKYAFLIVQKQKTLDSLAEKILVVKFFLKHYQTKINFQIQISTTEKPLNQDWLSQMFVMRKSGNRFTYFFGNFSSYWEAKRLADLMRKKGFDGYVVGWEGAKRVANNGYEAP